MSHISLYEADERRDLAFATPREKGRSVRDFYAGRDAVATPRLFTAAATPSARKVNLGPDLVAAIEEDEHTANIQELKGKVWRISRSSPWFNFDSNLKTLAAFIKAQLCSEDSVLNPGDELKVSVIFMKGLRGNREDSECIKLTIDRVVLGQEKCPLFTAYFLSVDSKEMGTKTPVKVLPLCLSSAADEKISDLTFLCLEKRFDCVIYPLQLEEIDLKWMAALWSGTQRTEPVAVEGDRQEEEAGNNNNNNNDSKDMVKFRFRLPQELSNCGLDTIDVKFNGGQIRQFWNSITSGYRTEMSPEDMETFHRALRSHVRKELGINLDVLELANIYLPSLSAARTGHVRMERVDKIKTVLGFLTTLCQNDVVSANPRLGIANENATSF